jgi:hypothetical protein
MILKNGRLNIKKVTYIFYFSLLQSTCNIKYSSVREILLISCIIIEMPMEQIPVLEIDGVKYHQHKSICRYIARKFKLCGTNEEESFKIDALIDDIDDIRLGNIVFIF